MIKQGCNAQKYELKIEKNIKIWKNKKLLKIWIFNKKPLNNLNE